MKVEVLGTGDAFSSSRYNASFIVTQDDFSVAIDCPHPYLKILKECAKSSSFYNINDIILTHLHGDHISGLDTFLFYKRFVEGRIINIYSTHHEELWEHLKCSMGKSFKEELLSSHFYIAYSLPVQIGPFNIEIKPTQHYVPCSALLVRGEKTIGFSADSGYDPNLVEWLAQADLLFHEVGPSPGHTPYEVLLEKVKQLGIKHKVRLAHFADSFNAYESQIPVAIDGVEWEI